MYGVGRPVWVDGFAGWVVAAVSPFGRPRSYLVQVANGGWTWAGPERMAWRAA